MTVSQVRSTIFGLFVCAIVLVPFLPAEASAQKACDLAQFRTELTGLSQSEQVDVANQYSKQCQEELLASLQLAPGDYDVTEYEVADTSNAARGTSCGTVYRSATKRTVLGATAYTVTQNVYRCWDTTTWKLTSTPNHYVTFSNIDPLFQIEGQTVVSEYWIYTWYEYRYYEQWRVRNCVWQQCAGTFYPTSQGYVYGNGNTSGSVTGG